MSVMKLTYLATEVAFDPSIGYRKPDLFSLRRSRTLSGKLHSYKYFHKQKWEIPVTWFNSSDTNQINTWWENDYDLEFYPDLINSPATHYTVKIMNKERPIPEFAGIDWETYYKGNIVLEEI